MRRLVSAMLLTFVAGCATPEKAVEELVALPDTHFRNTSIVKNDFLDTVATVSTEAGFKYKQGLLGVVWEDVFLRGFIDKKTKQVRYQVYQYISYRSSSWAFYRQANYEAPEGPKSVAVTKIGSDVDCTGASTYGGCRYEEHVAWEVAEETLRAVARAYEATRGQPVAWRYKVVPKNGPDFQGAITAAEVKGFLDKVAEVKASLP